MDTQSGTFNNVAMVDVQFNPQPPQDLLPDNIERRVVLDLVRGITNRQIMDVFFSELARVLNERGPDGTEDDPPSGLSCG